MLQRCWGPIAAKYPQLAWFACGLATMFPGTSTVDYDFSLIHQEAHEQRMALNDLSLKGILFSKQWNELKKL